MCQHAVHFRFRNVLRPHLTVIQQPPTPRSPPASFLLASISSHLHVFADNLAADDEETLPVYHVRYHENLKKKQEKKTRRCRREGSRRRELNRLPNSSNRSPPGSGGHGQLATACRSARLQRLPTSRKRPQRYSSKTQPDPDDGPVGTSVQESAAPYRTEDAGRKRPLSSIGCVTPSLYPYCTWSISTLGNFSGAFVHSISYASTCATRSCFHHNKNKTQKQKHGGERGIEGYATWRGYGENKQPQGIERLQMPHMKLSPWNEAMNHM